MSKELFVGTWQLSGSEMRTSSGEIHYPLGEDCAGLLMLDSAGHLSAQLMRSGRPAFVSDDLLRGTSEEIKAAYEGYVAFWARYEVDEANRTVTYVVRGSLFPNWIGHTNLRHYEFEDRRMTLRTPPFLMAEKETVGVLVWERLC